MELHASVGESLTLGFAAAAARRREAGLPVLSLGLGEPDFATPQPLIDAVVAVLAEGNSKYSAPLGVPALREVIAEKLRQENDLNAQASRVIVAAGAKQALTLSLMALLRPGDEVIVLSPMFVSFIPQIYLAEPAAIVHVVDMDPATLSMPLEEIKRVCNERTRAVLINAPNNPSGAMFTEAELAELFSLAVRHDFFVVSDEVYEKLVFGDRAHVSAGRFDETAERTITINGFSKSHALTGWRIGYAHVPDLLCAPIAKIQQHVNTNTCTFVQHALVRAWDRTCPHLIEYNETLARRAARVGRWLTESENLSGVVPSAGFFAFVRFESGGLDSNDFCGALLESRGVATTPGIAFGRAWDSHFRLSFAVDDQTLEQALPEIARFAADPPSQSVSENA